jgi:2-amino-4-hydroxy-6-hydroxymethyldihydropteridine diphosphokinase
MPIVAFGLGSNLGDKAENLRQAVIQIEGRIGRVTAHSALYASLPWGYSSENTYINACVAVETHLPVEECLRITQEIEIGLGRLTKSRDGYQDRTIDIDILCYDRLIVETNELVVPHPLLHERLFVLEPLAEILPEWVHPVLGRTTVELLKTLTEPA